VGPSISLSIHNSFLIYALQDKVQLGYISLGQFRSVGSSWVQLGLEQIKGVKSGQVRAQVGFSWKYGLVR
jgi:hypothetical protein